MPYANQEREHEYRKTPAQRARMAAYHKIWYAKNRDRVIAANKLAWANRDPAKEKARRRKRRYGLSQEEWSALFDKQGGLCALCREKPAVDVDHCHSTGKVRGLLCRGCNVGLGQLGDSKEGLIRAIAYLENFGCDIGPTGG